MRGALLLAVTLTIASALACANHAPSSTVTPKATISGRVRITGAPSPVNDRELVAFDTGSGKTYRTRTNNVGDYTLVVPPGRYRLEFTLRPNEKLSKPNPVLELHDADIKADINIDVVATPA